MSYKHYKNMHNLKLYLDFNKISYTFFYAAMDDELRKLTTIAKQFGNEYSHNELMNLYNMIHDDNFLTEYNYYDYSLDNNFTLGKGNHPLEDANKAWAKILQKHIENNLS